MATMENKYPFKNILVMTRCTGSGHSKSDVASVEGDIVSARFYLQ